MGDSEAGLAAPLSVPTEPPRRRGPAVWGDGVLLLYALFIVYASLHPFYGWRIPEAPFWPSILPRYHTDFDDFINVAAYIPFGSLLASALARRHRSDLAAILAAAAAASACSMVMETAQWFLPGRVASVLDWACNTLGALAGALLSLSPPGRRFGQVMHRWRAGFFPVDGTVDAGLIIVLIWLVAQTNPSVPFFEAGNMINQLTASWNADPYNPLFLIPQVVGVGLNVCGFALFVSLLLKGRTPSLVIVAILAGGLFLKFLAAGLMLKAPLLGKWLGPAPVLGLVAGCLALLPLLKAGRRTRIHLAVLLVFAGGLMSKMTSIYDAFDETLRLFDWPYGQLANFASLTRYLNEIWPLLVLLYLFYLLYRRMKHPRDGLK